MASAESELMVRLQHLVDEMEDRVEGDHIDDLVARIEAAWTDARALLLADMGRLERVAKLRRQKTRGDGKPRRMSEATIAEQERIGEMLAGLLAKVNEIRQMGQGR